MREWRERRRRSQLEVSIDVGVSTRHLSFVETGRSRPSPELVLAVAEHLEVPLRERNTMLLAAGYAPRYSQRALDEPAMQRVRASLQRMLDAHDPYPGVVIDRQWNVLLANAAAGALTDGLPAHLLAPALNVFRVCLHPTGSPAGRRTSTTGPPTCSASSGAPSRSPATRRSRRSRRRSSPTRTWRICPSRPA